MTRIVGLILLASAWVVVIVGMKFDHLGIPWFRGTLPVSYAGAPLLLAAIVLLLRSSARPRP